MVIMNVEEIEKRVGEVNEKIVEKIDAVREKGKKDMPKIRTARDYFCDAVSLAMEKRFGEASYKLKQSLEVLREVK